MKKLTPTQIYFKYCSLMAKLYKERDLHQYRINKIEQEIDKLQNECPHPENEREYHYTGAEENSYHTCKLCYKQLD